MTTILPTTESQEIDDAFLTTPDEVKNYLVSNEYELILLGIAEALSLTPEQTDELRYVSYELVLQTMGPEEGAQALVENDLFSKELATKAIFGINQEILSRIETILRDIQETDSGEPTKEVGGTPSAPSPKELLSRLNETLTKPAFTIPVQREYGVQKSAETSVLTKTPDPYREIPE